MKKLFPYLLSGFAVTMMLSCGNEPKTSHEEETPANMTSVTEKNGVHFESWVEPSTKPKVVAKKAAYVYYDLHMFYENTTNDTIWYLSTTCAGDANLIALKDKSMLPEARQLCNYTGPKVNFLAPHQKETIVMNFGALENKGSVQFSFYFRKVDKHFSVDNMPINGPEFSKKGNFIHLKNKLHPVPQD